ncbi:MAG TPA: hypothetical protein VGN69_04005 [Solirubrobacteraceae bacterium]|nr:hypothetical protein [Solirubrobacteraceae bacterium]
MRSDRADNAEHVLVLSTLGARERRLLSRRRPRRAEPEPEPEPVLTARATIIDAQPAQDIGAARRWLDGVDAEVQARQALGVLNRALHAYRIAAAEPLVREVGLEQALVARLGFGEGEQVADGRWTDALTLPGGAHAGPGGVSRGRRNPALRHQERFAALLGAREQALACEELVLRARADLDAGRLREGALELDRALGLALHELAGSTDPEIARRLTELEGYRAPIGELAGAAMAAGVGPQSGEQLAAPLERLEALLRALSAAGPHPGA